MITLSLPIPPSINSLYRPVRDKTTGKPKFILRDRVLSWRNTAYGYFLEQNGHKAKKITGHFRASIILDQRRRGLRDADNHAKAVLDLLQHAGLIANDRYCDGLTVEWGSAPLGCLVTVSPVE